MYRKTKSVSIYNKNIPRSRKYCGKNSNKQLLMTKLMGHGPLPLRPRPRHDYHRCGRLSVTLP